MAKDITAAEQEQIDLNIQIAAATWENRFEEEERRGRRDLNTGRFLTHEDYGGDSQLVVSFTTVPTLNKMASIKAGAPKYVDQDMITILVPGEAGKLVSAHGPVTDFYQWRFPNEYKAFKDGQAAVETGTSLHMWLEMTPAMIKELEFYNIRTVEQIANLSDSSSGVLRSFYALKAKAKQFLLDVNDKAKTSVLQMQIDAQAEQHANEMAEMKAQMAAFMEAAKASQVPKAPAAKKAPVAKKGTTQDK